MKKFKSLNQEPSKEIAQDAYIAALKEWRKNKSVKNKEAIIGIENALRNIFGITDLTELHLKSLG